MTKNYPVIRTLEFTTGADSCIIGKGEWCQFLGAYRFGTKFKCLLFDEDIHDDVNLLRCKKCVEHFSLDKQCLEK